MGYNINSSKIDIKSSKFVSIRESSNIIEPKLELGLHHIQKAVKEYEVNHANIQPNKFVIDSTTFFKYCCKVCQTKEDKVKFNTYEIANSFLTGRLDLNYYMTMIDHINKLKTLILKPYQIFLLDNQKKINLLSTHEKLNLDITDSQQLSSQNDLQMHLLQLIIEKMRDKSFDAIDQLLYDLIDDNLKLMIDKLILIKKF